MRSGTVRRRLRLPVRNGKINTRKEGSSMADLKSEEKAEGPASKGISRGHAAEEKRIPLISLCLQSRNNSCLFRWTVTRSTRLDGPGDAVSRR